MAESREKKDKIKFYIIFYIKISWYNKHNRSTTSK